MICVIDIFLSGSRRNSSGRTYEKIGYHGLDVASVAGSDNESKPCLLNGYSQTNNSPANTYS